MDTELTDMQGALAVRSPVLTGPAELDDTFAASNPLTMPKSAVLSRIRAMQPDGAEPLAPEDLYVVFAEAASDAFIPDRFAFLHETTLKNIARDMNAGVACMLRHDTGGCFTSGSNPIGKTFAARYEMDGTRQRVIYGAYMVRGLKPNGDAGPSTDDLKRMIDSATLSDNSVGLYGGRAMCDVCGHGLFEYTDDGGYLCPHVPGTTISMSTAEIKAQKVRGVPNGEASYSLRDAICGEVSAVYDGAVPGAGYLKSLALGITVGEKLTRGGASGMGNLLDKILGRDTLHTEPDTTSPDTAPDEPEETAAELTTLKEQYTSREKELLSKIEALEQEAATSDARSAVDVLIRMGSIPPSARDAAVKLALADVESFAAFAGCLSPAVVMDKSRPSTTETVDGDRELSSDIQPDAEATITRAREYAAKHGVSYGAAVKAVSQPLA